MTTSRPKPHILTVNGKSANIAGAISLEVADIPGISTLVSNSPQIYSYNYQGIVRAGDVLAVLVATEPLVIPTNFDKSEIISIQSPLNDTWMDIIKVSSNSSTKVGTVMLPPGNPSTRSSVFGVWSTPEIRMEMGDYLYIKAGQQPPTGYQAASDVATVIYAIRNYKDKVFPYLEISGTLNVQLGKTSQLKATLYQSASSTTDVTTKATWTTSNASVATIDNNGLVTGVNGGLITVSASFDDVGTVLSDVRNFQTLPARIKSITIQGPSSLQLNTSAQYTALADLTNGVTGVDVTLAVSWYSDNINVGTFSDSKNGLLKINNAGTIGTAKLYASGQNVTSPAFPVTSTPKELTKVYLDPEHPSDKAVWKPAPGAINSMDVWPYAVYGDGSQVQSVKTFDNGGAVWTCSDDTIAYRDGGYLDNGVTWKFHKPGVVQLTFAYKGLVSAPVTLTMSEK